MLCAIIPRYILKEAPSFGRLEKVREKSLVAKNVSNKKLVNISFDLYKGEVLGVYGLRGSGRTELLKTIFGLLPVEKGEIICKGKRIENRRPAQIISESISFVPENRSEGLFFNRPVDANITISSIERILGKLKLFLSMRKEKEICKKVIADFDLDIPSLDTEITYLSGGNKQKVMFAGSFIANSEIYLLDEATKGIDVGVKSEIYKYIKDLASQKKSILFTSSDIGEILRVSHRIMVLYNGQLMGIIPRKKVTKNLLIKYADGRVPDNHGQR